MTGLRARLKIAATQQEFLLNDDLVNIGRAKDNDIVLSTPDVSRHHVLLTWNRHEYVITDLGSSCGTHVNNDKLLPRIPRSLNDGDVIRIGDIEFRFFTKVTTAQPLPSQKTTMQPSAEYSQKATMGTQFLPSASTVVYHTPLTPVLQVTTAEWSRKFTLERDNLTLGRNPTNDIVIDAQVVSGKHAQLRRCDETYEIIDLGSRNGLTFRGHRINQKRLRDGDVLYISSNVTLTYQTTQLDAEPALVEILDLRNRNILKLGRDSQNDSVIDHPSVSRFHACIERRDSSLIITDLNSTNGTFVNGKKISAARVLKPGDTIHIGPCRLIFNFDETIARHNEEGNLRLDAVNLRKVVGKETTLLNDISFSILPREFVTIVGASGSGKSTLLDALNGFRPATSGVVLVNGIDLYQNFNAYRTELGYVPQKDIVHTELTVSQALSYAAKLRMPADTTMTERNARIQQVLEELGLSDRRDVPIQSLSGGQLKRVSIGVELLTKPSLFFLDEATSGLDPSTEADIMHLLRQLADQGRTVILVTHATENVMLCDLVVFMTEGGRIAYLGPPEEALEYFGVTKFNEIYSKVERDRSPQEWQKRYKKSPQYQQYIVNRQDSIEDLQVNAQRHRLKQQSPGSKIKQISAWRQFLILSQRNLLILLRDRISLILMLAIAPILGMLDFITWKRDMFDIKQGDARQAITMLFIASLVAVMVGGLATMREIVKEAEIYRREHMIGVKLVPYIFSKIWFVIILASYQAAIFLLFKLLAVDIPGDRLSMYITLLLTTIAGMIMGLLISAISPNQNVAPFLTIIFLVPQIIFGGGLLPVSEFPLPGKIMNQVNLTKWPFEALVTITGLGTDVAEDPCWQKSEDERKKLTDADKNKQCECLGSKLFKSCKFPGVLAKYDEEAKAALEQPEPAKPKAPGSPPSKRSALASYNNKVKKYNQDIEVWQKNFSKWKEKRESTIGAAEGLIDTYYKNYGSTFKVPVVKHWAILMFSIVVMLGSILAIQKRKDFN